MESEDRVVLRELASWQAEASASAANRAKIAAWYAHDAWAPERRPMVIAELRGWDEPHGPVRGTDLRCTEPWARALEYRLRMLRHHVEVLGDDHVVPPYAACAPAVGRGDFGVPSGIHRATGADRLAFSYRPPLERLDDADFARLHHRTPHWRRAEQEQAAERLAAVYDGLLPVRLTDAPWQFHIPLTSTAFDLVGLEGFMFLLHDNPAGVLRLMAFLRDDQMLWLDWLEAEGLLPANHEADYVGAGSVGYTHDLPAPDFAGRVRCRDRWTGCESQESVSISPTQYHEFVFPYLAPLMARCGKVYYGCCEPTHTIWDDLRTVPNLARVSVSPWADEAFMGRACRERRVVYSRKPSPNPISAERYDEGLQRAQFDRTVAAAQGCSLEIIQRDVYVTGGEPARLVRWVALAREACAAWRAA
jgi:hypothetical protein